MKHCTHELGSALSPDQDLTCGAPILESGHVCAECGGEFCSLHVTRCDYCGEAMCMRCAFRHVKVCAYNEVEAS